MLPILAALGNSALKEGGAIFNQHLQNQHQREFWNYTFSRKNEQQMNNNLGSASVQLQALKNAGLNPALAFGQAPANTQVSSGDQLQQQQMPEFDLLQSLQGVQNVKTSEAQQGLIEAQAKETEQKAKALAIENDAKSLDLQHAQSYDDFINSMYRGVYLELNPHVDPDSIPPLDAGWFKAHNDFHEQGYKEALWNSEKARLYVVQQVAKFQSEHPEIIEAKAQMDKAQLDNIISMISERSQKIAHDKQNMTIEQMTNDLSRDHDIFAYVDKLFDKDKDFETKDFVKLLVLLFMGANSVPSRSKPKAKSTTVTKENYDGNGTFTGGSTTTTKTQ